MNVAVSVDGNGSKRRVDGVERQPRRRLAHLDVDHFDAGKREALGGAARTAPETTNIKASIVPTHRAKGAVASSLTAGSYVNRHNEMADHMAEQPGDAAFSQHHAAAH